VVGLDVHLRDAARVLDDLITAAGRPVLLGGVLLGGLALVTARSSRRFDARAPPGSPRRGSKPPG
jgi:hypothetical protein